MGFPLGQPLRLGYTDEDTTPGSPTYGTLQDPAALTLLLQAPGGMVQTLTYADSQIVRDGQGEYHYDVTPQVAGKWSFRWIATGSFASATDQQWFPVDSSTIG